MRKFWLNDIYLHPKTFRYLLVVIGLFVASFLYAPLFYLAVLGLFSLLVTIIWDVVRLGIDESIVARRQHSKVLSLGMKTRFQYRL